MRRAVRFDGLGGRIFSMAGAGILVVSWGAMDAGRQAVDVPRGMAGPNTDGSVVHPGNVGIITLFAPSAMK